MLLFCSSSHLGVLLVPRFCSGRPWDALQLAAFWLSILLSRMLKLHFGMRMWVFNFTVTVPAGVSTVWREGKGSALGCCPLLGEGNTAQECTLHPGVQIWNDFVNITWVILSLQGHRWDHCLTKVRGNSAVPLLVGTGRNTEMCFLLFLCFSLQASSVVVSGSCAGGKLYPVLLSVILKEHIYCPFSSKTCNNLS